MSSAKSVLAKAQAAAKAAVPAKPPAGVEASASAKVIASAKAQAPAKATAPAVGHPAVPESDRKVSGKAATPPSAKAEAGKLVQEQASQAATKATAKQPAKAKQAAGADDRPAVVDAAQGEVAKADAPKAEAPSKPTTATPEPAVAVAAQPTSDATAAVSTRSGSAAGSPPAAAAPKAAAPVAGAPTSGAPTAGAGVPANGAPSSAGVSASAEPAAARAETSDPAASVAAEPLAARIEAADQVRPVAMQQQRRMPGSPRPHGGMQRPQQGHQPGGFSEGRVAPLNGHANADPGEFEVGDYVVYPTHGVGRVKNIKDDLIAGITLRLIEVEFEENRMTLRVPVAKARTSGLRKLATRGAIDEALETLRGRARVKRTMWSRRAQEYEAKINSGDPIAIAEVVRDLHRNAGQPDQSFSERQIYEQAMDRLASELAAIEKIKKDEATVKLHEVLKTAA